VTVTRTITLGEELERLNQRADEIAEAVADADDSASGQAVEQVATDFDQQGRAVASLVDEYGPEATVTIRRLGAGEYAFVEDRVATHCDRTGQSSVPGYRRNQFVAIGLVDAPFFERDEVAREYGPDHADSWGDLDRASRTDAVLQVITDAEVVSLAVVKWLFARIDEEGTVDSGNWRSLAARIEGTPASDT
jgi:hypothetical protein